MKNTAIFLFLLSLTFVIFSCTNTSEKDTDTNSSNQEVTDEEIDENDFSNIPEGEVLYAKKLNKADYPLDMFIVQPSEVLSSGYLEGYDESYVEENMTDHDPFTWWTPNPNRNGEGAWIELVFQYEMEINGFEIWGGSHNPDYPEYGDIYPLNNRVKRGVCEFSDSSKIYFELNDIDDWQLIRFDESVYTNYIKIQIFEVYKGEKWDDLCIAEFLALSPEEQYYDDDEFYGVAKPVIYLYPEKVQDVNVQLDKRNMNGTLDVTYPEYQANGWNVKAFPNGKLIDKSTGKPYNYLFWEGSTDKKWNFDDGFVVKGNETAEFLEEKLSYMGLEPNEYNDFIVYWLPLMQNNEYNHIRFPNEEYNKDFPLNITPQPDNLLRVYMIFKPLDSYLEIPEQKLEKFNRKGFTVVEWGGSEINDIEV